jgi:hypothetical protein
MIIKYLEQFDQAIVSHVNKDCTTTLLFKDLLTIDGKIQQDLIRFLGWLLSNNGMV